MSELKLTTSLRDAIINSIGLVLTFKMFDTASVSMICFLLLPMTCLSTYLIFKIGEKKKGRLITLLFQLSLCIFSVLLPSFNWLTPFILFGSIWMSRILLYQKTIPQKCLDVGLLCIGGLWSYWVFQESGSLTLFIWSFCLSQSLWVIIANLEYSRLIHESIGTDQSFDQAFQRAETALQKMEGYKI